MARRKRYDVFVSYSHNDAAIVKPLVQVLGIAKRRVFWDEIIQPGQEWNTQIETALAASDVIVIMWCCDAGASDWVMREIKTARRLAKPLTPIRLCAYPLRGEVIHFQAIDLSKKLNHGCACAREEERRRAEAATLMERMRKEGVGRLPHPSARSSVSYSHPYPDLELRSSQSSLRRSLLTLLIAAAAGYSIYRFHLWRTVLFIILALVIGAMLSAGAYYVWDRVRALRASKKRQHIDETITLIKNTLASTFGYEVTS